jgi:ATP-dependent DNA helicase PIF1
MPFYYDKMALNPQQKAVVDAVLRHESVFFTGCAGTGKSYLVKTLVQRLPPHSTWLTAMTGIAALAIGGKTLHSQTGIGLARASADVLAQRMKPFHRQAWRKVCVLIIDEVSMLSRELFEKLEEVARRVRSSERPFGGVQVVLCGDMFQLPPVSQEDRDDPSRQYCFESPLWKTVIQRTVELTHVYRQADAAFVQLLSEVRHARLSAGSIEALAALERPLPERAGVLPTRLFATNAEAESVNQGHLDALPGPVLRFEASDTYVRPELQDLLDKTCAAPKVLDLRVGAQVLLLKNLAPGLVNGSRGVVTHFHPATSMPYVRFLGAETEVLLEHEVWEYESRTDGVLAARAQVPLRLAWAITIHKSQGMSLDYLEVSLDQTFETGQVYVALSRARTLDGLRVLGFHPGKVRTCPRVQAFAHGDPPAYAPPPYDASAGARE